MSVSDFAPRSFRPELRLAIIFTRQATILFDVGRQLLFVCVWHRIFCFEYFVFLFIFVSLVVSAGAIECLPVKHSSLKRPPRVEWNVKRCSLSRISVVSSLSWATTKNSRWSSPAANPSRQDRSLPGGGASRSVAAGRRSRDRRTPRWHFRTARVSSRAVCHLTSCRQYAPRLVYNSPTRGWHYAQLRLLRQLHVDGGGLPACVAAEDKITAPCGIAYKTVRSFIFPPLESKWPQNKEQRLQKMKENYSVPAAASNVELFAGTKLLERRKLDSLRSTVIVICRCCFCCFQATLSSTSLNRNFTMYLFILFIYLFNWEQNTYKTYTNTIC